MPPSRDAREEHPVPPEAPEADVIEQALPITADEEPSGIDAERVEPISDDDWGTPSGS